MGLYILKWGPYIIENINTIKGTDYVNLSKVKKIVIALVSIYIIIFLFFMLIGPVSFPSISKTSQFILKLLFVSMGVIAVIWNLGIILFYGFVNYQIDKIAINEFNQKAIPFISVIIAILLLPIYLLAVPYTQYKLNRIIKLYQRKEDIEIYSHGENKEKILKKARITPFKILIGIFAIFMIYQFSTLIIGGKKYDNIAHDIKFSSDTVLELLINKEYDVLYDNYGINTGTSKEKFLLLLEEMENTFGDIISYTYDNYSVSGYKKELTRFSINYQLESTVEQQYRCTFDFYINKKTNRPYKDKILRFCISSEIYDSKYFCIHLM
jgi:hypothetical protein